MVSLHFKFIIFCTKLTFVGKTGGPSGYGSGMPSGPGGYQQPSQSQQQPHPGQTAEIDVSTDEVWVETKAGDGKSYFYHAKSRETTWTKPEGPNIKVLTQQQVTDCFLYSIHNLNKLFVVL